MNVTKTQEAFSGLIEKPSLTEQLLSRPPFKFIVDIVTNVIKSTGYLKKEFPSEELSNAGNDKNTKVAFLDKLITILNDGDLSNVKSAKIVAGKDPDDTNLMLQKLASNARSSMEKEKPEKSKSKDREKEKSSKSKDKKESGEVRKKEKYGEDGKERKKSKEKKEEKLGKDDKKEKKERKSSKDRSERSKSKEPKEHKKHTSKEFAEKKEKKEKKEKVFKRQDSMIAMNGDNPTTPNEIDSADEGYAETDAASSKDLNSPNIPDMDTNSDKKEEDSGIGESPRLLPPEQRNFQRLPTSSGRPATSMGRPQTSMGRPGTAASRPAPPKIKKKQIAVVETVTAPVVELASEIMTDAALQNNQDDDAFIVEEEDDLGMNEVVPSSGEPIDDSDRGALVQKIMEKKAELEDGTDKILEDEDQNLDVEKEKASALQTKLQTVTRAAFPLARIFDYATDDIESMMKEMERWRTEARKREQDTQKKEAGVMSETSKLTNILAQLDQDILDMKQSITTAKARILSNEERLQVIVNNI